MDNATPTVCMICKDELNPRYKGRIRLDANKVDNFGYGLTWTFCDKEYCAQQVTRRLIKCLREYCGASVFAK